MCLNLLVTKCFTDASFKKDTCVCWGGRIRKNAKQVKAGRGGFIGEYGKDASSLSLHSYFSTFFYWGLEFFLSVLSGNDSVGVISVKKNEGCLPFHRNLCLSSGGSLKNKILLFSLKYRHIHTCTHAHTSIFTSYRCLFLSLSLCFPYIIIYKIIIN